MQDDGGSEFSRGNIVLDLLGADSAKTSSWRVPHSFPYSGLREGMRRREEARAAVRSDKC